MLGWDRRPEKPEGWRRFPPPPEASAALDADVLPELDDLRDAIDDIDGRILDLLRQRIELVLQVGEVKRKNGVQVYDPERERRVLDALGKRARPPLQVDRARRIFERIIDEARRAERAASGRAEGLGPGIGE